MKTFRVRSVILTILILFFVATPIILSAYSEGLRAFELLKYYFDLVISGNYESASGIWEPSAGDRAGRLGIEYNDIPVKADCESPVLYDTDALKKDIDRNVQGNDKMEEWLYRLKFSCEIGSQHVDYFYYLEKLGDDYWIIYPQDYYAKNWPVRESKYFRFHINPDMDPFYNDIAAAEMDRFVDRAAGRMTITSESRALLEKEKIDYYLCRDKDEVAEITGQETSAYYDRGADALITSEFPAFHLAAKLLINFRLQRLPLFTLPLMKEGVAIYLGGRWQRSPEVIMDFAEYILNYNLTEIDSVLIRNDLAGETLADITYPVDACLIDYLFSRLGEERFFNLYLALSGDVNFNDTVTAGQIKGIIADSLGMTWDELKNDFSGYFASGERQGGLIYPGEPQENPGESSVNLIHEDGLVVSRGDKWVQVEYSGKPGEMIDIHLLFDRDKALEGKISPLYDEQSGRDGAPFEGYRYGIRLDKNEIGLYDYADNLLKAKYVYNFDPDPSYYDSSKAEVKAYFNIDLLGNSFPDMSDHKISK